MNLFKRFVRPQTISLLSSGEATELSLTSEYNLWLAAEHGMFLRHTMGEWMTTMPECLQMDWVDSVKHVFEYFTERTPRSYFELRQTSLVWNYKYSGPISNASLDVVQGARPVEARAVGVTKGAAIDRILGEIIHNNNIKSPIDYVLCVGHFLPKDEDINTFFDPELPAGVGCPSRARTMNPANISAARFSGRKNIWPLTHDSFQSVPAKDKKTSCNGNNSQWCSSTLDRMTVVQEVGSSVLDLKAQNYLSCAVGRKRSTAKYLLGSSSDVVHLLRQLADCSSHN